MIRPQAVQGDVEAKKTRPLERGGNFTPRVSMIHFTQTSRREVKSSTFTRVYNPNVFTFYYVFI